MSVDELRTAAVAALTAAQEGIGPLFSSSLKVPLEQRPQDFLNDQIPLVRKAAEAQLKYLDAEAKDTDDATTPAALKRKVDRDMSQLFSKHEEFEKRVLEQVDDLRARGVASEDKVSALLAANNDMIRAEISDTIAQTLSTVENRLTQLELRVLTGSGMAVAYPPLFVKLGYAADTTVDAFKNDIAKKTELNYAGKGLDADDARALAGILGSFGKMVDFRTIDLSDNNIGNVGMTALAQTIKSGAFDGLEVLKLFNCGFGYKGFHAFTNIWIEYRTFRLIELTLGGIKINGHFDLHDCLTEIDRVAEAGLCARMERLQLNDGVVDLRGKTFRGGAKSSAGVPMVGDNTTIDAAYKMAANHIVLVTDAKNCIKTVQDTDGEDGFSKATGLRSAFWMMTGQDTGLVLLEMCSSSKGRKEAKFTRNGVTNTAYGYNPDTKLTPIGSTNFT